MTGLQAHELGVGFDRQIYDRPEQTLAERFRERGYRTAAVISNSFLNAGSGFARGFDTFQQAQAALDICRTAPGVMAERHWSWFAAAVCNWTASEVTRRAQQLMTDGDRPLFLVLNYMDGHDPYYVEPACGGDRGYRAAIECMDRSLAPVVDWRSARRPTVLVMLSDHGELFGEHGLERHGNSLHVQLLHVPMMIRPATPSDPRAHTDPISIAALPTLLGVRDATSPPDTPALAVLHPPAAEGRPSAWSALNVSWHLIVQERGSDALYNLASDPLEEHNVVSTPPPDPAIDRLRAAIEEMRRAPRPDAGRFRSLGYIH
jgi:arylsulfatase A-like enzyme